MATDSDKPPAGRRRAERAVLGLAAVIACALATGGGALAITGGREDAGPLRRSAVMVLGSAGNVCTGIVVAPSVVLTAGHCATNAAQHRVHYMEGSRPILLTPAAVAVHPGYDKGAIAGRRRSIDLALIRLDAPLPASFAPIALDSGAPPRAGADMTVGGYGSVGRAPADGRFRTADLAVIEPYGPGKVLLWLGDPQGRGVRPGAGACEGDSGGLIAHDDLLTAVTTWSKGDGKTPCGMMTQGVLVAPQRAWIDRTLAGWGEQARWD